AGPSCGSGASALSGASGAVGGLGRTAGLGKEALNGDSPLKLLRLRKKLKCRRRASTTDSPDFGGYRRLRVTEGGAAGNKDPPPLLRITRRREKAATDVSQSERRSESRDGSLPREEFFCHALRRDALIESRAWSSAFKVASAAVFPAVTRLPHRR
ncbi:hypothetical protein ISCGN_019708, partial [Ixodes scapularis]